MPYSLVGNGICKDKNYVDYALVATVVPGVAADCDSYCQQNPINELVGFHFEGALCRCYFSGGFPNPMPVYTPPPFTQTENFGVGPIASSSGSGASTSKCYKYDVSTH